MIISSVGFVYSQSDTIPAWIKGVAGFWAEDKITDQEFIEALEFLIESEIIQVDDSRITELEKENNDLKQELRDFKNDKKTILEPMEKQEKNSNILEPYIITDNGTYSLNDVVKVSGLKQMFQPRINLKGDEIKTDNFIFMQMYESSNGLQFDSVFCNYSHKDEKWIKSPIMLDDCPIIVDNDGAFTYDIKVDENWTQGTYYFTMTSGLSSPYLEGDRIVSNNFLVK